MGFYFTFATFNNQIIYIVNLVIDKGNTQCKIGIFDQYNLVTTDVFKILDKEILDHICSSYPINKAIYSSVIQEEDTKIQQLLKDIDQACILNHHTALPFEWNYATKETMGKDRLAAVAGALHLVPNENLLIIDAGTAITYEFVTKNKHYLGGNIAPGMSMRFAALNHFTSKLPLLQAPQEIALIGNSTTTAIQSGVINGMINEIEGYIYRYKSQMGTIKTILTGGDAVFFESKLKNPIFVHPNLVLIGLNRILEYNA